MTPKEFAKLLRLSLEIHEKSWDGNRRYRKTWEQACEEASIELVISNEWAKIASILLFPGYADVWDWCERIENSK